MVLEQKLLNARENRRKRVALLVSSFLVVALLSAGLLYYLSNAQIEHPVVETLLPNSETKTITVTASAEPEKTIADDQLRSSYINALNAYQNDTKPKLNNIDLERWDSKRSAQLITLESDALSHFSAASYAEALENIEASDHLAQTIINDSELAFEKAMNNARHAYDEDNFDEAKFQITQAQMLNKGSAEATFLAAEIDRLPEILKLAEKIHTARVENQYEKELKLLNEMIKLAPERGSISERKRELTDLIANRNFESYIAQSYQAIKQSDLSKAKQRISAAKKIFPKRSEIQSVETAIQDLEKKQRIATHQQAAKTAMAADNWPKAKQQLELVLKEQVADKITQQSLDTATQIIAFNNEFDHHIANPYRLSNKQLASSVKTKIENAKTLAKVSPSLDKKANTLSLLIEKMNQKIPVEVISDNQTNILVRGLGIVGLTESKTIQLTPGRYSFEGKRKGYKSKLLDVLISYDDSSYQVNIICDEPI